MYNVIALINKPHYIHSLKIYIKWTVTCVTRQFDAHGIGSTIISNMEQFYITIFPEFQFQNTNALIY